MTNISLPADRAVTEAATELVNFAWSAVVTDCNESAEYLNELVGNLRAALSLAPPVAPTGTVAQPEFTYYECPECGFDCIHRADYEPRSTACPICAGDSGHDVGMTCRPARSSDRPEGKDARESAALSAPMGEGETVREIALDEDELPDRIWAGDFDAQGFGHCVAGKQGGLYAEYVRADLASPTPPSGQAVKALEWKEGTYTTKDDDNGPMEGVPFKLFAWRADKYIIIRQRGEDGLFILRGTADGVGKVLSSLEVAKAAAQADYEARIRSALV